MTLVSDTQHTVTPSKPSTIRLAAIGLGERAAWITQLITEQDEHAQLDVLVDPNPQKAQERITQNKIRTAQNLAVFDSIDAMLQSGPEIHGVIIGVRCNLHTPLALKLASLNIPLFLEKPVCINWQQYEQLEKTYAAQSDKVVISFPLRVTPLLQAVREYITQGRLGTINQIQAVNNVSYGSVYVDSWYRDYEQTGGLWLQKATHDFDYIHYLANAMPLCITAMHSRCVWQEPVLHQDAGSAIVQYDSGFHANYTQNFITRQGAGRRGATITGEDGTISFDWTTDQFTFHSHKQNRVETVTIKTDTGHGGGDPILAKNFLDVIRNRDVSQTPLREGLLSAGTCLAARDSANQLKVVNIPTPFGDQAPSPISRRVEPLE
ncbi:MAG TPA: oxidoreductase [Phycisphaerales bacterium]|nr:oxidoreductase [Phycisphaerales bacterium]|tara:strand:- start:16425 stop:17558 length:1134 start_codon:yes stop_codon:yes gene_type:complete